MRRQRWDHPGLECSVVEPLLQLLPRRTEIQNIVRCRRRDRVSMDDPIPGLGFTPLSLCVGIGAYELVESVLDAAADVNAEDDHKHLAIYVAARENLKEIALKLLGAGANVNKVCAGGDTALSVVACNGNITLGRLLLSYSADTNHANRTGQTVLMYASLYGRRRIVDLLVEHRAECEKSDVRGWTALMYGSYRGDLKTVQALLRNGAFVDHKDSWGKTALDIARGQGYKKVVKSLEAWQTLPQIVLSLVKIRLPDQVACLVVKYWNNDMIFHGKLGKLKGSGKSKKECVIV